MVDKFNDGFNPDMIDLLAGETGFSEWKSKLRLHGIFESLIFVHHQGKCFSLMDLYSCIREEYGVKASIRGIDDRFDDVAILFFHRILDR